MSLNRNGIEVMIVDMLKADTTVLYGNDLLLQSIVNSAVEFEKAKVGIRDYKMFLNVNQKNTIENRAQNKDCIYTLNYRIEGQHSNPDEAQKIIDKIDEQMDLLIDAEFSSGDMLTSYYTDTKAQVYDCEYDNSELTVETVDNKIIAECEGAISVYINREV